MTQKSDDKLEALRSYAKRYGDDSHVSEAMWFLHEEEDEVVRLIKLLPVGLRKKIYNRRSHTKHDNLKKKSMDMVAKMGLRPNTEVKIGGYRFDVVGLDVYLRPLVAVECGGIHNKAALEEASHSIGTIYHWPYGQKEPHALGRCSRCKW